MQRIGVDRVGERQRRLLVELQPQAPVCQFEVPLHFAGLDLHSPPLVAVEHGVAEIFHFAALDVDLSAGNAHIVAIAGQQNLAGHQTAVA